MIPTSLYCTLSAAYGEKIQRFRFPACQKSRLRRRAPLLECALLWLAQTARNQFQQTHVSRWSDADFLLAMPLPKPPFPPLRERHWRRLIHPRSIWHRRWALRPFSRRIPGARCPATFSGSCSSQASGLRACFPQSDQLSLYLSPLRSLHCPALPVLECGRPTIASNNRLPRYLRQ